MNLSDKDIHLIERFCWGSASTAEREEVEARKVQDPAFAKELRFQLSIMEVVAEQEESSLKALMKEEELAYELKQKLKGEYSPVSRRWMPWALVASFALIVVAGWWLSQLGANSYQDTFEAYYKPYRNTVEPIVRSQPRISLRQRAFAAYEQEEWEEALSHLDSLAIREPSPEISFYKSHTLLSLRRFREAVNVLQDLNTKGESPDEEALDWYLALGYLGLEEVDKSLEILEAIQNKPAHSYKQPAKQLLEDLSGS
ncbi:MAG: hypothetical protein AAF694_21885 [Bacteroidota bacterium]